MHAHTKVSSFQIRPQLQTNPEAPEQVLADSDNSRAMHVGAAGGADAEEETAVDHEFALPLPTRPKPSSKEREQRTQARWKSITSKFKALSNFENSVATGLTHAKKVGKEKRRKSEIVEESMSGMMNSSFQPIEDAALHGANSSETLTPGRRSSESGFARSNNSSFRRHKSSGSGSRRASPSNAGGDGGSNAGEESALANALVHSVSFRAKGARAQTGKRRRGVSHEIPVMATGWPDNKYKESEEFLKLQAWLEAGENMKLKEFLPWFVDNKHVAREVNMAGYTALHLGVMHQVPLPVLQSILAACPESVGRTGRKCETPLHSAMTAGARTDVVDLLVDVGHGQLSVADYTGHLPLHSGLARPLDAKHNVPAVLLVLDAFTAAAKVVDPDGFSPLHLAVAFMAPDELVLNLLQSWPTATTLKTHADKMTPLFYAITNGKTSATTIMSILHVNPSAAKDFCVEGRTPLHIAVGRKYAARENGSDVVAALLAAWPDAAKCADTDGRLPLHWAMSNSASAAIVKVVTTAYPEAAATPDKSTNTPLHYGCCMDASAEASASSLLAAVPASCFFSRRGGMHVPS